MRMLMSAIGVLMCSVAAAAQGADQHSPPPERGSIGLPLPQIGVPHPPMGLPPVQSPAVTSGDRSHRRGPGRRSRPTPAVPVYPWPFGWVVVEPARAVAADPTVSSPQATAQPDLAPESARLRVVVEPRVDQQVYVDGYYVGDFDSAREGFEIAAGTHSLEVRAEGYDPLEVPIRLDAGRPVAFRGQLQPASRARIGGPQDAPTAATPMTFYAIPGCYLGNVPPQDAGLPTSCDLSKTITVRP